MNLFQVPQPTMGLMGRLPSSRLQGRNRVPGMPGMDASALMPPPADAIDELMMLRQQEAERVAAERRAQDEAVLSSRPRERVSGWRLLDRVLGGQTVTEGLDAERARLTADANRGSSVERQRQILATIDDPYERSIFLADPEKWVENAGYRLRPVTTAEGSITTYGPGPNARQVAPKVIERFDDRFGVIDPLNTAAGPQYTAPRGMTAAEETGRINATNGVNVGPGSELRNPQTGELIARGPDRVFSAADSTDLVNEQGQAIYRNQRDAPTAQTPQNVELQGQLSALDTDVDPVLNEMESMLKSGDVITGLAADQRLAAARALAAAGNDDARRQVTATERYLNMAGRLRVGMAKSLGANPSNADLIVLREVTAGDLGQSAEGLLATVQDGRALSQRQRSALRGRLGSAPQGGASAPRLSPEAARALPRGTRFIGLDGVERVRQ